MALATVTSKGQITIPKSVRERLGLKSGDKVDFRVGEDGTVTVVPITRTVESAFGAFAHKVTRPASLAEMSEGIAAAVRERSSRRK
jgi:AbrB family looped-hinge helix DNA binding protein